MALGIACAGTGLREAIALLEPMAKFDPVNFVRQGALVSFLLCTGTRNDSSASWVQVSFLSLFCVHRLHQR